MVWMSVACKPAAALRTQRRGTRPIEVNDNGACLVFHAMRSTITVRGQTVVPAPIRERFGLGPSTRLEWIVDGDGSIRVVPAPAAHRPVGTA